ncbi:hypothetical protein DFH08DRAFT_840705 [Mycena albidolilacea]|uniref:Uncharacterized protein n=1 Tax=Mycena albidolilacea TaxID=1033008 RepID=A0AAD7ALA5_9AGAR|nr:hypothetical protein DFH08DRAFT_840705 [Mycena albidolilacea]
MWSTQGCAPLTFSPPGSLVSRRQGPGFWAREFEGRFPRATRMPLHTSRLAVFIRILLGAHRLRLLKHIVRVVLVLVLVLAAHACVQEQIRHIRRVRESVVFLVVCNGIHLNNFLVGEKEIGIPFENRGVLSARRVGYSDVTYDEGSESEDAAQEVDREEALAIFRRTLSE